MGSGRGWLAGDWPSTGGVLNITGGLDCELPLMAFWQQKANAKCYRVHACTRSMPGVDIVVIDLNGHKFQD